MVGPKWMRSSDLLRKVEPEQIGSTIICAVVLRAAGDCSLEDVAWDAGLPKNGRFAFKDSPQRQIEKGRGS